MSAVPPRLARCLRCSRVTSVSSVASPLMAPRRSCATRSPTSQSASSPPTSTRISTSSATPPPPPSSSSDRGECAKSTASSTYPLASESKPAAKSLDLAVASLRDAVSVWSTLEKQKMKHTRAPRTGTRQVNTPTANGDARSATTTTTTTSSLFSTTPAADTAHTDTQAGESNRLDTDASSASTTPTSAEAAGQDDEFGVRNKQDRFWEYVYTHPLSTATEGSDASTTTPTSQPATTASGGGGGHPDKTSPEARTPSSTSTPSFAAAPTNSATASTFSTPAKVTFSSVRQSTSIGRTRPPLQPFRSRPKRQVAMCTADVVNADPSVGVELVSLMSAESRRLMVVMGTASEYFGGDYGDVAEQVKMADRDRDRLISSEEYDTWATHSFQRRDDDDSSSSGGGGGGGGAEKSEATTTSASSATAGTRTGTAGQHVNVVRAIQRHPDADNRNNSNNNNSNSSNNNKTHSSTTSGASQTTMTTSTSAGSTAGSSSFPHTPSRPTSMESMQLAATTTPAELLEVLSATTTPAPTSSSAAATTTPRGSTTEDTGSIPWSTWWKLVLAAAPPFFAFGLLDNTTFVLSGDAIDRTMSEAFHMSEMAAAALGGVVSGVAGIQVHGLAEKYTRPTPPPLTAAQKRSPSYHRADHVGNTLGMVLGLVAGMAPLLWLHKHAEAEQNEDIKHDIALMREEAMQSATRRVQREGNLRHLLVDHEHQEREEIMKQARAEKMKIQMGTPTRTPENLDDRHNPH